MYIHIYMLQRRSSPSPQQKWEKGGSGDLRFINHLFHFILLPLSCFFPFFFSFFRGDLWALLSRLSLSSFFCSTSLPISPVFTFP